MINKVYQIQKEGNGKTSNVSSASDSSRESANKSSPILIHCSAGIGRSGTFCCVDICVNRLNSDGMVDVYSTVRTIREQRAFSIQTDRQYEYCYLTILEYALNQRQMKGLETENLEEFLKEWRSNVYMTEDD